MKIKGKRIGYALTGSFCTFAEALEPMRQLAALGADLLPILSRTVAETDTRFYTAKDLRREVETIAQKLAVDTIPKAEPIGPKALLDLMIVAPCTGNTLGKLANGITDTPVTMACKAHLRNGRPVLLAISTNDGLSANAQNIGKLLGTRGYFFVPFRQDNPQDKPTSLVALFDRLLPAAELALEGRQIQPVLG